MSLVIAGKFAQDLVLFLVNKLILNCVNLKRQNLLMFDISHTEETN